KLRDSGKDLSAAFVNTFCSLLQTEKPDGGDWGQCTNYVHPPAAAAADVPTSQKLEAISNNYRVLVVPGVLSSCQANTQAFQEGQAHLKEKHGMTVEFLQMPNDTSTANGQKIATYLRNQMAGKDSRKYVVVSYSKGAPDVQEGLAGDSQARSAVAALV